MDVLGLEKPEDAGVALANARIWQTAMILKLALGVGFASTPFLRRELPNKPLKLTILRVTVLAYARTAPLRLAA